MPTRSSVKRERDKWRSGSAPLDAADRIGPVVFLRVPLSAEEVDTIAAAAPHVILRYFGGESEEAFEAAIEDAEVILGNTISPSALKAATRLRWVHSWAAGPNELLYPEMIASPVVLTSSAGSGAIGIAEHALMLMLMLNTGARDWIRAQQDYRWERHLHPELSGSTCGILGVGHAGQELAARLRALNVRVLGMRRTMRPAPNVHEMFTPDDLRAFLGRSDFVVVTAALTRETKNMLLEDEFRAMKPTAYYICSSRGGIANDAALLRALTEGWIAGAGLDAFAEEPLPTDSPFWTAPNTIVTPHNGALTPRRMRASLDMFIENLHRYISGEQLANMVDKDAGY